MALKFMKMTRPAIRALTAGKTIREHGIEVTRLANGDANYRVNIMVDGQRINRAIGKESQGVTREQAERAIEVFRTKAREGRLDLPIGRKVQRTLADAADEYIERLQATDGKGLAIKRRHISQRLKPAFGSCRLDKVAEHDLRKYRLLRVGEGASEATVNREMATLSHLLRSAVRWKWIRPDALPAIPKVREGVKATHVLTSAEADALMQAAIEDQDDRLWLFVTFGLNAAMRHREILSVRYDQIDFEQRRIFIPQAKSGERIQPITRALTDALKRQRQMEDDADGWVFPTLNASQSKAGHRTNMARPFARAVKRAKLNPSKVTPHTMRHTAITRMVQAGVDLPTIQGISGHKTLAMVLRYTHVHANHVDAAISVLDMPAPRFHRNYTLPHSAAATSVESR